MMERAINEQLSQGRWLTMAYAHGAAQRKSGQAVPCRTMRVQPNDYEDSALQPIVMSPEQTSPEGKGRFLLRPFAFENDGNDRQMAIANRIVAAVRDGRMQYGIRRRLVTLRDQATEMYCRLLLKVRIALARELPSIGFSGDFSASDDGARLKKSFEAACRKESVLPDEIRRIVGMSGQNYRSFINNYVHAVPDARYLEIGSWTGSTATAALFGNQVEALCIDNWALFGGPKDAFFENMKLALSDEIKFRFKETDFRAVDYGSIGQSNIYLFDGPHEEADQYDGVVLAQPALTGRYLLIVDDWNWRAVRNGTFRALIDVKCRVEAAIEVRTTLDNSHPVDQMEKSDWHNGYFMAVIVKST
jgi:hypothetical protein